MPENSSNFHFFRILVSGAGGGIANEVEQMLEKISQFRVLAVEPNKLRHIEKNTHVDAVVLGFDRLSEENVDLINEIRAKFGEVPVVAVTGALDEIETRQLIKLKVHDWLHTPLEERSLINATQSGIRGARMRSNKVHAVVSGAAGVGATTVAVSFTDLLVADFISKTESAALFDLDFSTGDCGYVLNMINSYNLEKVLSNPQRIDAEFANLIQERERQGFYVYSFRRPEIFTNRNGCELVMRMLDAVNIQHEHTVLDIPYYETEWRLDALSAVNTCTVVTEANLPALKHAIELVHEIREIRGPKFPLHVLVNKHKGSLLGERIGKSKLKELFGDTPFTYLPRDDTLIEESLDRGILPREISPRSAFIRHLRNYMKGLLAEVEDHA